MISKKFLIACLLLATLFLATPAMAAVTAFSVDEPDGTNDTTSLYYTISWTPQLDTAAEASSMQDANTISCWLDGGNTVYSTSWQVVTNEPCCDDTNAITLNLNGVPREESDSLYYVWCISDQNSDVNAYSSGQLTLTRHKAADVGPISIDVAGVLLVGIADNIGVIAGILVATLVVIILVDLITGVFGLVNAIRGMFGRR